MKITSLRGYLGEVGLSANDLCKQMGYNPKYFSRALHSRGNAKITGRLSKCVESYTDGVIKLDYDTPTRKRMKKEKQQQINKEAS